MPRVDVDLKLDFKDVLLRPKRSSLKSRAEVGLLESRLGGGIFFRVARGRWVKGSGLCGNNLTSFSELGMLTPFVLSLSTT